MNLFRQQDIPQSLQKLQLQAKNLHLLCSLEENRRLPGTFEIRHGLTELLRFLERAYPARQPTQAEMFSPQELRPPVPTSSGPNLL